MATISCSRTQAAGADGSFRLTGTKTFVCADGADGFLVSANGRDGPAPVLTWRAMLPAAAALGRLRRWTAASFQPSTLRMHPPISSHRANRRGMQWKRSPISH